MARPSALEDHLGYWLRFVSNHVSQAFAAKVQARGVSVAEWVLLRELLGRDGDAPSALAERMGMTRGGVSKLVDKLIRKDLISRHAETSDRRYQALALTAAGRALVPALAALADKNDDEFFGHLPAKDRAALGEAIKAIVRKHGLKEIPVD